ncbi:MAG: hypothetical protein ACJ786_41280 [Catenulispora sp.]
MSRKTENATRNTTPDPTVVRGTTEIPNRASTRRSNRSASIGANAASGDAELAILVGAP